MAFRLKPSRPLAKSIRRVGLEQIKRATRELAHNPNPHEGVHQARKAFKRLRALLRLLRPIIGEAAFQRENERYRDIAAVFSGPRDAQAMLDALAKLELRCALKGRAQIKSAIAAWLRRRRAEAERALDGMDIAPTAETLSRARWRFLRLPIGEPTFDALAKGLAMSYRAGRRSFVRAYTGDDDELFHDWRKATQRCWRHLQLVAPAWPEALAPRITLAQELSQLLGDDHDLSVLRKIIAQNSAVFGGEQAVAEFLDLCKARQEELRRLARARGARLFGEKPKAFRRRIANYWRTASEIAPLSDVSVDNDGAPGKNNVDGTSCRAKVVPFR